MLPFILIATSLRVCREYYSEGSFGSKALDTIMSTFDSRGPFFAFKR